ncbi:MAG: hypothetical protein E6Q76_16910 [Rhizobium sp.]|nr:MAG: hypothetical protein E6Q76_16910 [Rhizobium sp.]
MPSETQSALRSGGVKYLQIPPFTVGPLYDSASGDNPVKVGQFVSNTENYFGLVQFQCNQNRFATISAATLHLKFSGSYSSAYQPTVVAVAADNQGWPATPDDALNLRLHTTSSNTPVPNPAIGLNSIDVKDIVQEIVNRTGWVPGNHLMFWITWTPTGNGGSFATDNNTTNGPWLDISGTGGDGGSGGGIGPGGQSGTNASILLLLADDEEGI